jgi:hypothetical protein
MAPLRFLRHAALLLTFALPSGCASNVVAVEDRAAIDEFAGVQWRSAAAEDISGHWRLCSLQGHAAAVLMDVCYWLDADGHFSGAALFSGPPPAYEVLSGSWTLSEEGLLQLGADAALALAEVPSEPGRAWLRLSGDDGCLVLERAETR